jgi:hypothetical protein
MIVLESLCRHVADDSHVALPPTMNPDIEEGIWWKLCFVALNYDQFDEPFLPLRCALAHHLLGFKPNDHVNTSMIHSRWRSLTLMFHPDKYADASPQKASRMKDLFQLAGCCKDTLNNSE